MTNFPQSVIKSLGLQFRPLNAIDGMEKAVPCRYDPTVDCMVEVTDEQIEKMLAVKKTD